MSELAENIGFILQARSGSTRMLDKMLRPFYNGKSILEILIKRFKTEAKGIPFIIATTTNPLDDRIEDLAKNTNTLFYRGSEENVLKRFIDAAVKFGFKKVIRVCADNPLFDISGTIKLVAFSGQNDYTAFKLKGDKPTITTHNGFWGEVVSLEALKKVMNLTNKKIYLEHVTNFIYTQPDLFDIKLIKAPEDMYCRDDIRLTVDTIDDYRLVSEIYSYLRKSQINISVANVLKVLNKNPGYLEIMKTQIRQNTK